MSPFPLVLIGDKNSTREKVIRDALGFIVVRIRDRTSNVAE